MGKSQKGRRAEAGSGAAYGGGKAPAVLTQKIPVIFVTTAIALRGYYGHRDGFSAGRDLNFPSSAGIRGWKNLSEVEHDIYSVDVDSLGSIGGDRGRLVSLSLQFDPRRGRPDLPG
jgi:hypothetical protein